MFRCRLIRTVVNLSLIVAMIMQPGMSLVFANDCGAKCASGYMCEGCGCCAVTSPEAKCCCCSSSKEESTASCYMGLTESLVVEHSMQEVDKEVASGCHCGFQSQPIGDSASVQRIIEQRDSVAIRFANLATIFGEAVPRPPSTLGSEDASSMPHFSQIQLCIWRL